MAAQCPNKTLLIEELDAEEEVEEVVYEPKIEDESSKTCRNTFERLDPQITT